MKPKQGHRAAPKESLISINEAAARGIERLRKPIWATPLDHLKIDIIDGRPGPWLHLYCPFNRECNGRDPVDILGILEGDYNAREFVAYVGPRADSPAYKAEQEKFDGCLSGAERRANTASATEATETTAKP